MSMGYPEVKVHFEENEVTVSWEEASVLYIFCVELGKKFEAEYRAYPDEGVGEHMEIYAGSKDANALASVIMTRDLTLLLKKHKRVNREEAYSIIHKYYKEIRQNRNNPTRIREIVRSFRSEVLGILEIEH